MIFYTHLIKKISSSLALILLTSFAPAVASAAPCIHIYYDKGETPEVKFGELHATALQNLLGHFPTYQQKIKPVDAYIKGEIDQCQANFYVSTLDSERIPKAFLDDFRTTAKTAVWIGRRIEVFENPQLKKMFGFKFVKNEGLHPSIKDPQGLPTFFKDILYKGETFSKYGARSGQSGEFDGSPEIVRMKDAHMGGVVLASARHNGTHQITPYAIRKGNFFYIADNPFNYIHEDDRYLVFADLLFDMLGESPRYTGKRPAVFRIEDVSSCTGDTELKQIAKMARETSLHYNVSLIPIFADPFNAMPDCRLPTGTGRHVAINDDARFASTIRELVSSGGRIVWHGVTHQYDNHINPSSGISGDDYEFWDIVNNRPPTFSTPKGLVSRLDEGWNALTRAGLESQIWEVPHYLAGPFEYRAFAHLFSWTIGRITYFPHEVLSSAGTGEPSDIWYGPGAVGDSAERGKRLSTLDVKMTGKNPMGQFFPYEIYGDAYGQRVIPENLGYFEQYDASTVDKFIARAKRNKVLRDTWASLYFHPYLLSGHSDLELRRLIKELRKLDYEFVDLDAFISDKKGILRPEPEITSRDFGGRARNLGEQDCSTARIFAILAAANPSP